MASDSINSDAFFLKQFSFFIFWNNNWVLVEYFDNFLGLYSRVCSYHTSSVCITRLETGALS